MGNKDKENEVKGTGDAMFMTVKEVAEKMSVSESTAYEFIKSGNCGFQHIKLGKKLIRIHKKSFYTWYDNFCK